MVGFESDLITGSLGCLPKSIIDGPMDPEYGFIALIEKSGLSTISSHHLHISFVPQAGILALILTPPVTADTIDWAHGFIRQKPRSRRLRFRMPERRNGK